MQGEATGAVRGAENALLMEKLRELGLFNSQKRILKGKHTMLSQYIFGVSKDEKVLFSGFMQKY